MYVRFSRAGCVFKAVESTFDEAVSNLADAVPVQIEICSNLNIALALLTYASVLINLVASGVAGEILSGC